MNSFIDFIEPNKRNIHTEHIRCKKERHTAMGFETILHELVIIFAGVAILATVFLFLKQPIIIAYIGLGMIAGPFGFGLLHKAEHIEHISHLGIVLLLFLIGLNLHPNKLTSLFKKTALATALTSIAFLLIFGLLAFAFKFTLRESMIIGIALMFSSTIVGLKLIPTTTLHQMHLGEMMVSVLLLQDIIAILAIILLDGSTGPTIHFQIPLLIGKAITLVLFAFLFFKYCILWLCKRYDTIQEYLLVLALGWCLAIAGVAKYLGLSYEIGAFVAGCSFALSPVSLIISERLKSLREFFLILFFFSIGAKFDFLVLKQVLLPSFIIALAVVVLKPILFTIAFRLSHENKNGANELGFRLGQSSEFSLLVAYMAIASSTIALRASYVIQLTTIITWIVSTYIVTFRYATPIAGVKALRKD